MCSLINRIKQRCFNKQYKTVFTVTLALVFIFIIWSSWYTRPTGLLKDPSIKYILLWTSPNIEPLSLIANGRQGFISRKCPVNNCYVTSNRNHLRDITDYDAILFHVPEVFSYPYIHLPRERTPNQTYVFASMESAHNYPAPRNKFNNFFNMTWTYKLDSDLYFGYLTIKNKNGEVIGPNKNIDWLSVDEMLPINDTITKKLDKKSKFGAWFVSNCDTAGKRNRLVSELKAELNLYGMGIDVYGKCGTKSCPRSAMNTCLKLIERDYYFYLALENSLSEDYVTEKLLHALNNYAVPLVYGGANYTRFMPDSIYVDSTSSNVTELVKEMVALVEDREKYYSYFKWHNHYTYHRVEDVLETNPFCKFCEYMNKHREHKSIDDIEGWWNDK